ncbi:hypothetical protein KKZ80_16920, partial [Enterobacter kobei]|nr:hypothetical protein [Enterobacter kobei]
CVCGKKIGPDPRNFNQRVSLGRNDLLIRTFPLLNQWRHKRYSAHDLSYSFPRNGDTVEELNNEKYPPNGC